VLIAGRGGGKRNALDDRAAGIELIKENSSCGVVWLAAIQRPHPIRHQISRRERQNAAVFEHF
jgi:hypothetical protein